MTRKYAKHYTVRGGKVSGRRASKVRLLAINSVSVSKYKKRRKGKWL